MKKVLVTIVAVLLVFTLVACTAPATETPASEAPASEAPASEAPADGGSEMTGKLVFWTQWLDAEAQGAVIQSAADKFMADHPGTEIFSGGVLSSGPHFENYQRVLEENKLGVYFGNSLIDAISGRLGIILITASAAYVLGHFKFAGKKLLNRTFIMALSAPIVLLVLPLYQMAVSANLIGSRRVLILLYICTNVPFGVYFLAGFFKNLPKELEEAAEIDDCTPAKAFWRIMFPLAQSGIITLIIFNFINIWNKYFMARIFANKVELRTVSTELQSIIQAMQYAGDWAGLFSGVVLVFLPTFILYVFLSKKIIVGVTGGAVRSTHGLRLERRFAHGCKWKEANSLPLPGVFCPRKRCCVTPQKNEGGYYCVKCSFTGSEDVIEEMYLDMKKKYRLMSTRITLSELEKR